MAIGSGLPDVRQPGVSSIPDVTSGAGLAEAAQATAWSQVAATTAQLGEETQRLLANEFNKRRAEAGRLAGVEDAQAGIFEKPKPLIPNAYDAAYEAANEAAYMSQKAMDVDSRMAELFSDNPLDADAFRRAAIEARVEDIKASPVRYQAQLAQLWAGRTEGQVRRIAEGAAQGHLTRARDQLAAGVEASQERVLGFAAEGSLMDPAGLHAMAEYEDQWRALTENPAFNIPKAYAQSELSLFQEQVAAVNVMQGYLGANDLRAASEFARDLGFSQASPQTKTIVDQQLRDWIQRQADEEPPELAAIDRAISDAIYLDDDLDSAENLLRSNAPIIDPDRYKVFAGAISNARRSSGSTDKTDAVYALDLETRASEGLLQGAILEDVLREGLLDGRLSLSDARTIRRAAQGEIDDRSREMDAELKSFFDRSPFAPAELFNNLAVQEQNALMRLRDWRAQNTGASRDDERAYIQELAADYRRPLLDALPTLYSGMRPRSMAQLVSEAQAFQALYTNVNADTDPGNDISPADIARELSLLQEYRTLLEKFEGRLPSGIGAP